MTTQPGSNVYTQGFGSRPENVEVPFIANRAPTISDVNFPIGKRWIDQSGGDEYVITSISTIGGVSSANWASTAVSSALNILTGNTGGAISPIAGNINLVGSGTTRVAGSGNTLTITASPNGYPITPFVVGPIGEAGYQTVQAAVTAAGAAGGGIVYIQPGTYTENVTMGVGVHLVGLIGTSGNMTLTSEGGEVPPVEIIGNFNLDVTAAQSIPTTEIHGIMITATSGNVFTYVGNSALLESGYLTFFNCHLQTGTGSTALFNINGFMNINFESSVLDEETVDTTTFCNFVMDAISFVNFSSRNSVININKVNACIYPDQSFITWAVENSFYTLRQDITTGTSSLSLNAVNSFFNYQGASSGDALIEFGSNDGSVIIQNCIIENSSGSLGNSTTFDANSVFEYTSCVFNNPLIIGTNGRGTFNYCTFYGGSSADVTMSSSQAVSLIDCIFTSSHNPSIAGSGSGTLTLGNLTFLNNSSIANTLTLTWIPTKTGALTTTGATTVVGTTNINASGSSATTIGTGGTGAVNIGNATGNTSVTGSLTASTTLTATLGNITATNGNLSLGTAGNKIVIATGSNASVGTSGVMSGTPGAVTVSTTACSATAKIFYCRNVTGGTPGNVSITAQNGTGFTLTSTGNETSTFNWWIINA